jgi:hypothetical protein
MRFCFSRLIKKACPKLGIGEIKTETYWPQAPKYLKYYVIKNPAEG